MRAATKITMAALLGGSLAAPASAVVVLQTDAMVSGISLQSTAPPQKATVATRPLPGNTTPVTTASGTPNYIGGSALLSTVSLSKFSSNTGILLGATVNVKNVATSIDTRVSAATSGGTAAQRVAKADSTNWKASVSGTGFTAITSGNTSSTRSCTATGGTACTNPTLSAATSTAGTFTGSAAVAAGSLGSYIGTGSVDLVRSATGATTITPGQRASTATAQSVYTMAGGTYQIVYDYINFSQPSFDANGQLVGKALDFGRIAKNTSVTLNFTLYNIGGVSSTGMDLVSISRDVPSTPFTTTASPFTNLPQGGSQVFSVTFNPLTNGSFADVFHFKLADYIPAGAVGGRDYNTNPEDYILDLAVSGATIPEPATWATLVMGFALVGASARRRRGKAVAA